MSDSASTSARPNIVNPAASSSSRDGTARAKVQQLKPTNKAAPAAPAPASSDASRSAAGQAESSAAAAQAPQLRRIVPRIITGHNAGTSILVNSRQKGNPLLQHIRNVGWEYGDIVPDYQVGVASCVLFLSLRYHRLHPEYIHSRIQALGNRYSLRVLLVQCDVDGHDAAIKELTKVAIINNLTMMVAWTAEEAGRYVEMYKSFETKPPDLIRERVNDDYLSHLQSLLTAVRGINKTDVLTLATNFGSVQAISSATAEELSMCPGFGETKARRLADAFNTSFRPGETRDGRERAKARGMAIDADNAAAAAAAAAATKQASAVPPDAEAVAPSNSFDNELEGMTEEEQLQLALEMSIGADIDLDDLDDE